MKCFACGEPLGRAREVCTACGKVNPLDFSLFEPPLQLAEQSGMHCPEGCAVLVPYWLHSEGQAAQDGLRVAQCPVCKGMLVARDELHAQLQHMAEVAREQAANAGEPWHSSAVAQTALYGMAIRGRGKEQLEQIVDEMTSCEVEKREELWEVAQLRSIKRRASRLGCPQCARRSPLTLALIHPSLPLEAHQCPRHGFWLERGDLALLVAWARNGGWYPVEQNVACTLDAPPAHESSGRAFKHSRFQRSGCFGLILLPFVLLGALGLFMSWASAAGDAPLDSLLFFLLYVVCFMLLSGLGVWMNEGKTFTLGGRFWKIMLFGALIVATAYL